MASCDLQTTLSQEDIVNDGSSKKNDTEIERKREKGRDIVTKIPGPVMLNASGSFISLSNRQYTSVMDLAKRQSELRNKLQKINTGMGEKQNDQEHVGNETKVEKLLMENNPNLINQAVDSSPMNQADDSGVQLDCSTTNNSFVESLSDELPSPSPDHPILHHLLDTINISTSNIDMQSAEQQSLREIQKAVAEMEADVAAHSEALEIEMEKERKELEVAQDLAEIQHNYFVSKDLISEDMVSKDSVADDLAFTMAVAPVGGNSLTVEPIDYNLVAQDLVSENIIQEEANSSDFLKDLLVVTPLVKHHVQGKPIEKEKVEITVQARLTPASSTTGSLTDRKMVRLDQLLDAENNIDLLRQLLENDTYNDVMDSSEMDTAAPGIDKAKIKDEGKASGFLQTVLQALCSRKMLQPILLCSMAVGLVYFLRKV